MLAPAYQLLQSLCSSSHILSLSSHSKEKEAFTVLSLLHIHSAISNVYSHLDYPNIVYVALLPFYQPHCLHPHLVTNFPLYQKSHFTYLLLSV